MLVAQFGSCTWESLFHFRKRHWLRVKTKSSFHLKRKEREWHTADCKWLKKTLLPQKNFYCLTLYVQSNLFWQHLWDIEMYLCTLLLLFVTHHWRSQCKTPSGSRWWATSSSGRHEKPRLRSARATPNGALRFPGLFSASLTTETWWPLTGADGQQPAKWQCLWPCAY